MRTSRRVPHAEIESLFLADPWIGPDAGRHVFAVFTWRLKGSHRLVRLISARYVHHKEIDTFEKAIS